VRLYEAAGMDVTAELKFGSPVQRVEEVDLMEQPLRALESAEGVIRVHLRPFEILSIKVG
jgi:alpha-mannosidase